MKTSKEIAKEILYMPVTNNRSQSSIDTGALLIEEYAGLFNGATNTLFNALFSIISDPAIDSVDKCMDVAAKAIDEILKAPIPVKIINKHTL